MQSSNKTGLVLKISIVLVILLATIVYKLNDYFRTEQLSSIESRLQQKVALSKTTVSSQLAQLKNVLSSYENGFDEANINWVQLDPFFAIASVENQSGSLKVNQMLARSNAPAERWNKQYLERALLINKAKQKLPILAQLFQDKAGFKFLVLRFDMGHNKEVVVVGGADYFQKFFDLERGEKTTALLATTENMIVAHSEGNYIATQTQEARLSPKKYLFEKTEIVGTNIVAINYILKNKIASSFAVPWSIVGVVSGVGCILMAILFYSLDPLERKIERFKRQERAQIYKDHLNGFMSKSSVFESKPSTSEAKAQAASENKVTEQQEPAIGQDNTSVFTEPPPLQEVEDLSSGSEKKASLPKNFYSINKTENPPEGDMPTSDLIKTEDIAGEKFFEKDEISFESLAEKATATAIAETQESGDFLALDNNNNLDMSDIEKALALDDFDSEETSESEAALSAASMEKLKENLAPQTVSLSRTGSKIDKPDFELARKDYKVDDFDVKIRKPENLIKKLSE